MAFNFSGKKVLVTGAGRGIGRGIALALARADCKVYALDCIEENLDILVLENSNIVPIVQDLRNWEATRVTLEGIEALDGLVNNAGILKGVGPALDVSKEDIDDTLAINMLAVINCTQVIGKKMVEAGKNGSIVNISSVGSMLAAPQFLAYLVSKAGADMVTKQFALELGPNNIRVNAVNPALVDTDLVADVMKGDISPFTERMPLSRVLKPGDIAGPVLYLLSEHSAMVTGTTNAIDGGLSCNITTKS